MTAPVMPLSFLPMRGIALGVVVLVKQRDPIVEAHEQVHIRQQWRHWLVLFAARYFLSRNWRARYEAEAFAESVKHGMAEWDAVQALFLHYRLRMTEQQCQELLRRWL